MIILAESNPREFSKLGTPIFWVSLLQLSRFLPDYVFYFIIINMIIGIFSSPTLPSFPLGGNLICISQIPITRMLSGPQVSESRNTWLKCIKKQLKSPTVIARKLENEFENWLTRGMLPEGQVYTCGSGGLEEGITELQWSEVGGDHRHPCWLSFPSQQSLCPFLVCSDT